MEGIDIPVVDLVYFCDTKNSKIDIIQAIGRVLRITKDKTKGYIVVSIYHNKSSMTMVFSLDGPTEIILIFKEVNSSIFFR